LTIGGAALSHRSAAEHWGLLDRIEGPTEVTIAGDGGRTKRRAIRLHRSVTLDAADVTIHRRIPVTKPGRTICDLRRRAGEAELRLSWSSNSSSSAARIAYRDPR
jgi:hypothetical protein